MNKETAIRNVLLAQKPYWE